MSYLNLAYEFLNTADNKPYLIASFIALFALTMVLRLIACTAFRTCLFAARLDFKDIKGRDDIKRVRNGLLKKVTFDYIRIAEKNVSRVPMEKLAEKHVSSLSFIGWRYTSMQLLVEALETGLLIIGFIMAVAFFDDAFVYGTLTAAGFVLTRLMASLFDTRTAMSSLIEDIIIYVEREIGQFFASDASSVIARMQVSYDNFCSTIKNLDAASSNLAKQLQENTFTAFLQSMHDNILMYAQNQETFIKLSKYIERNQEELEQSLHSYESTLQNMTRQMGDGLGAFFQVHAQSTAQVMNDALQANIGRVLGANQELIQRVTAVLEDMRGQNRDISSHLLSLHEKLEIMEKDRRL